MIRVDSQHCFILQVCLWVEVTWHHHVHDTVTVTDGQRDCVTDSGRTTSQTRRHRHPGCPGPAWQRPLHGYGDRANSPGQSTSIRAAGRRRVNFKLKSPWPWMLASLPGVAWAWVSGPGYRVGPRGRSTGADWGLRPTTRVGLAAPPAPSLRPARAAAAGRGSSQVRLARPVIGPVTSACRRISWFAQVSSYFPLLVSVSGRAWLSEVQAPNDVDGRRRGPGPAATVPAWLAPANDPSHNDIIQ